MAEHALGLLNETDHDVRVAILPTWTRSATVGNFAWQIVALPKHTAESVVIPQSCQFVAYFGDPEDALGGNVSNAVEITTGARRVSIFGKETEDGGYVVRLSATGLNGIGTNVEIENQTDHGVWLHMAKQGVDIIPPNAIPPGRVFLVYPYFDYRLVVVDGTALAGSPLCEDAIRPKSVPVKVGQTAMLTGRFSDGYVFAVSSG